MRSHFSVLVALALAACTPTPSANEDAAVADAASSDTSSDPGPDVAEIPDGESAGPDADPMQPDAETRPLDADLPGPDADLPGPDADPPGPDADPPGPDAATSPCGDSPQPGGSCSIEGFTCTFGDDPRASCRPRATCQDGSWQVFAPRCIALGDCPATAPERPSTCEQDGNLCAFESGARCSCTTCAGGDICTIEPQWMCLPPPSDERCPRAMPNLGTSCSAEGVECDYGACYNGFRVRCSEGLWVQNGECNSGTRN